jgi:arginine-tRNA-protein transferase
MSEFAFDLPEPKVARRTPGPATWDEVMDDEALALGEEVYWLTVQTTEEDVDLGRTGQMADEWWAEGWNFTSMILAARANAVLEDAGPIRSLATRYRLENFRLSRAFKRVMKRNADLLTVFRPLRMTPGKDELHGIHILSRFKKVSGPLTKSWPYIVHYPSEVNEMVVFSPEGRMIGLSIIEAGKAASYGTQTVWHPEYADRSLGTFCMLKSLEYARERGFQFHYVGPTIFGDPNFTYKLRFPGCELYRIESNEWLRSDTPEGIALLTEPFPRKVVDPPSQWVIDLKKDIEQLSNERA